MRARFRICRALRFSSQTFGSLTSLSQLFTFTQLHTYIPQNSDNKNKEAKGKNQIYIAVYFHYYIGPESRRRKVLNGELME